MLRVVVVSKLLIFLFVVFGVGGCGDDDGGGNINVNQNDNSPGCGNGVREGDEVCDGADVGAETCEARGFHGGMLGCGGDCSGYDESNCELVGWCGDGHMQSNWESCDGSMMYPPTCVELGLGYDAGLVGCAGDCTYDESQCSVCGDLVVEGTEPCDEDNDEIRDGCHNCQATEFIVGDATGMTFFGPRVAYAPDGGFVVAYSTSGATTNSYVRRFDAQGLAAGAAVLISSPAHLDGVHDVVYDPSEPSGRLLTAWVRQDGIPTLMGRYLDANLQPEGAEFVIAQNPGGALIQSYHSMSMNAAGELVVAFMTDGGTLTDGDGAGVFARRFDAAGAPVADAFQVNTTVANSQQMPCVGLASDGRFLVAWDGVVGSDANRIYLQRYDSLGVADGGEINLMPGPPSYRSTFPGVAMAPDGRSVVMWTHCREASSILINNVIALRLDADFSVDGTELVVDTALGFPGSNAVAMADDGSFMLAWASADHDLSLGMLRAQRYDALGAPHGDVFSLITPDFYVGEMYMPAIGMAAGGNTTAVWGAFQIHAPQDSRYIYALRFDAQGRRYSLDPW
jgi:hypothetical protein